MPNTYTLIERITVGAAGASSITFTSIPQTYTDLKIVCSARTNASDVAQSIRVRPNASSTGYTYIRLTGNGSSAGSQGTEYNPANGNTATASTFSNNEIYIPNYTSSNNKSISADGVSENNASEAYAILTATLWANSAAITSLELSLASGLFQQYSTFYLYGIAKEGVTPTPSSAPYATGGDSIVFDGTYWIHTFYSSGTFTPKKGLTCDYLVVAGGGGAQGGGGGGGAGGLRSTVTATGGGGSLESALSVTANTAYTITVGGGGAGGNGVTPSNASGSNSSISGTGITTVTSTGGGGGADYVNGPGATGGSGGGGAWTDGSTSTYKNGGAGTANQGYAGGSGNTAGGPGSGAAAGGGGGAGAVGGNQTSDVGGNGGAGVATSISGSSVTYAGGGGGYGGLTAGTGGAGGGGAGNTGSSGIGTAGTANTGGGAGAGYDRPGAAGGSGIVIVRYAA
jgi:hypothetical protein